METYVWNIKVLKQQLNLSVCTHILFIHEIYGRETNPTCMALIKELISLNTKPLVTSVSKFQCLTHRQYPQ